MQDPRTIIQSHGLSQQIWPVGVHPDASGRRLHPLENTSRQLFADVCICMYMYVYTYMYVYMFIRDIYAKTGNKLHSYTGLVVEVTPFAVETGVRDLKT